MSQLGLEASHDGVFFADKSWESLLDRSEEYRRLCLLPTHLVAPLLALWEITGRCNLRCQYCYVNAPKSGPDLSSAELRDLARQLVEQRLFSVCLSGGEPTLHPDYLDLLRILHDGGVVCGTVTNGWTMTPRLARSIRHYVSSVQVSLDGPCAEIHDAVRGKVGSFGRALKAIRLLQNAGVENINVAFAATRSNADFSEQMVDLCMRLGVRSLRTQPLAVIGRAAVEPDVEPSEGQRRKLEEMIKELGGRCGELRLEWGDPSTHIRIGLRLGLVFGVRITSEGEFGFTPYYPIFVGNARRHTLKEAWQGGLCEAWRNPRVLKYFGSMSLSSVLREHPRQPGPLHLEPLQTPTFDLGDAVVWAVPTHCATPPTGPLKCVTAPSRRELRWRWDGEDGKHIAVSVPSVGGVFILNPSAARIFAGCDGTNTIEDLALELASTYGVDTQTALEDVKKVLNLWQSLGMLS